MVEEKRHALVENTTPDVTSVQKIHAVLRNLQKARMMLSIVFADSDQIFTSVILEAHTTAKQNYFVLDELIPREGNHKAIENVPFSISATFKGINIFFRIPKVMDAGEKGGILFYTVAFPEKMRYQQLRNAFRVEVPEMFRANVTLTSPLRTDPIEGYLDDISASGGKIIVAGTVTPELENNEVFESCHFLLPNDKEPVVCSAILRRAIYDITKKTTSIGLQFQDLSGKDQSRLARFVITIELNTRRTKK